MDTARAYHFNRISRSAPLASFIFNLDENIDALAERLVKESLLAMFRKLHPEKAGWNLSLMNVAVTNMIETAGDQKQSSGRDISKMFRQQETVLKDFTVQDFESSLVPVLAPQSPIGGSPETEPLSAEAEADWDDGDEDEPLASSVLCPICGASIPHFAQLAHEMYHSAPE
jgi:DNA polymerase iota